MNPPRRAWKLLVFQVLLLLGGFLDRHVVKFFGIKDIATLQALNILGILVSGNNSNSGMFAGGSHGDSRKGIDALPADCIGLS